MENKRKLPCMYTHMHLCVFVLGFSFEKTVNYVLVEIIKELVVVVHPCSSSTWKAEAGGFLEPMSSRPPGGHSKTVSQK